jgi:hypothetical protein
MQFSLALFAILSAAVQAAPMTTCALQAKCLDFTIEEVTPGTTCAGDCDFKVCMTVNQDPDAGCTKSGAISHTCEKPDTGCTPNGGGFDGITSTANIGDGYTSCQIVTAGDTAEFLMKDGPGNCGPELTSGIATCTLTRSASGWSKFPPPAVVPASIIVSELLVMILRIFARKCGVVAYA